MNSVDNSAFREIYLNVPLLNDDIKKLKIGDIVFLTGTIFTAREGVYDKIFNKGLEPPVDMTKSNANFHCSPAISETGKNEYRITSVTGTASFRFAKYMSKLIEKYNIKAFIGKTGMPKEVYTEIFKPNTTIYLNTIGYGLGAIYGKCVKEVTNVVWAEELGLAQALCFLKCEKFGPLIVECDAKGNSLSELENRKVNEIFLPVCRKYDEFILKRYGEINDFQEEII